MTRAPCAAAIWAVLSVELLSTTMISPARPLAAMAAFRLISVWGSQFSSL
ncbi:MAG: hypothetical protein ABII74_00320 [Elusimicrobiota bacterium]